VALGRVGSERPTGEVEILGQIELEGRTYSAALVPTIGELLARAVVSLADVGCLVAVNGPGSFTGVRVGLSTVKGLAEGASIPIVAVSRLETLAWKAGTGSAAIDAHRSEAFLRLQVSDGKPAELLAGAAELAAIPNPPAEIAICDDGAEELLRTAWPKTRLARVSGVTAADAIHLAALRIAAGKFVDPLLLDGHYLRRSDAEIFGESGKRRSSS
jgi:tRNA threonylcarbamoyladenosine biosynthesis protein TsaB